MVVIRLVFLSILALFTEPSLHSQTETGHRGFCFGLTASEDEETNKPEKGGGGLISLWSCSTTAKLTEEKILQTFYSHCFAG